MLNSKVNDLIKLLDTDKEGNPIYPAGGMPRSLYNPDNKNIWIAEIKLVFGQSKFFSRSFCRPEKKLKCGKSITFHIENYKIFVEYCESIESVHFE